MVEPLTLAGVGVVALTEGIKFLYAQAGEALKRWREHKAAASADSAGVDQVSAEPVSVQLPAEAFEGQLQEPRLQLVVVAQLEQELRDLRAAVADYAQGVRRG